MKEPTSPPLPFLPHALQPHPAIVPAPPKSGHEDIEAVGLGRLGYAKHEQSIVLENIIAKGRIQAPCTKTKR